MSESKPKPNIAFKLEGVLLTQVEDLKEWTQIKNNTDMVRFCITNTYERFLEKRRELDYGSEQKLTEQIDNLTKEREILLEKLKTIKASQ